MEETGKPFRRIIVINGSGGCGKSSFVQFCAQQARDVYDNLTVVELSTVDYVKMVAQQCGWLGSKTDKDRAFLHDLKDALAKWNNLPNKKVFEQINALGTNKYMAQQNIIYFVNIRETSGYNGIDEFIKQNETATGVPVSTLLVVNANVPEVKTNEADADVKNYNYDYICYNRGSLEEWRSTAHDFLSSFVLSVPPEKATEFRALAEK